MNFILYSQLQKHTCRMNIRYGTITKGTHCAYQSYKGPQNDPPTQRILPRLDRAPRFEVFGSATATPYIARIGGKPFHCKQLKALTVTCVLETPH